MTKRHPRCSNCGQEGHFKPTCPLPHHPVPPKRSRAPVTCGRCGKKGHDKRYCAEREEVNRLTFLHRHGVKVPRGRQVVALGPDDPVPEGATFLGFELPFQHTPEEP